MLEPCILTSPTNIGLYVSPYRFALHQARLQEQQKQNNEASPLSLRCVPCDTEKDAASKTTDRLYKPIKLFQLIRTKPSPNNSTVFLLRSMHESFTGEWQIIKKIINESTSPRYLLHNLISNFWQYNERSQDCPNTKSRIQQLDTEKRNSLFKILTTYLGDFLEESFKDATLNKHISPHIEVDIAVLIDQSNLPASHLLNELVSVIVETTKLQKQLPPQVACSATATSSSRLALALPYPSSDTQASNITSERITASRTHLFQFGAAASSTFAPSLPPSSSSSDTQTKVTLRYTKQTPVIIPLQKKSIECLASILDSLSADGSRKIPAPDFIEALNKTLLLLGDPQIERIKNNANILILPCILPKDAFNEESFFTLGSNCDTFLHLVSWHLDDFINLGRICKLNKSVTSYESFANAIENFFASEKHLHLTEEEKNKLNQTELKQFTLQQIRFMLGTRAGMSAWSKCKANKAYRGSTDYLDIKLATDISSALLEKKHAEELDRKSAFYFSSMGTYLSETQKDILKLVKSLSLQIGKNQHIPTDNLSIAKKIEEYSSNTENPLATQSIITQKLISFKASKTAAPESNATNQEARSKIIPSTFFICDAPPILIRPISTKLQAENTLSSSIKSENYLNALNFLICNYKNKITELLKIEDTIIAPCLLPIKEIEKTSFFRGILDATCSFQLLSINLKAIENLNSAMKSLAKNKHLNQKNFNTAFQMWLTMTNEHVETTTTQDVCSSTQLVTGSKEIAEHLLGIKLASRAFLRIRQKEGDKRGDNNYIPINPLRAITEAIKNNQEIPPLFDPKKHIWLSSLLKSYQNPTNNNMLSFTETLFNTPETINPRKRNNNEEIYTDSLQPQRARLEESPSDRITID